MDIPYPGNPKHVDNLRTFDLLAAQKFVGPDKSLRISLQEYYIAWRVLPTTTLFIYAKIPGARPLKFDRCSLKNSMDVYTEFDWVDWSALYSNVGLSKEQWDEELFCHKIMDLVKMFGAENIFGESYYEGWTIT